jgi:lysine-specific demethylase 8
VVVVDAMRDWPALARWDPDYVRAKVGERQVRLSVANEKNEVKYFGFRHVPFSEYVDVATGVRPMTERCYLTLGNIKQFSKSPRFAEAALPELADDIPLLPGIEGLRELNLWMGYDGVVTGLHYDDSENLLGLIRGRKRIVLFDYSDADDLYMFSALDPDAMCFHSPLNLDDIDYQRYPRARRPKYYRTTLEAGEMLYIPRYWWHAVRSEGFNIAANYWYAKPTPAAPWESVPWVRHRVSFALKSIQYAGEWAVSKVRGGPKPAGQVYRTI